MSSGKQASGVKWIVPVAAVVAAAGLFLLWVNYRGDVAERRQSMTVRGETVLSALVSGTRAHGRMGRFRAERLSMVFEEFVTSPGIIGVILLGDGGKRVASAGEVGRLRALKTGTEAWNGDVFAMAAAPDSLVFAEGEGMRRGGPGSGGRGGRGGPGGGPQGQGKLRDRGGGAGPPGREDSSWETRREGGELWEGYGAPWQDFPEGPFALSVALDASGVVRQIQRDHVQWLASSVIWLVAVSLATLVALARNRHRGLEAALAVAQERAAHSDRLAQLGAGLTHETKNPLGVVRGLAQAIGQSPAADTEVRQLAARIVDEADRTVGQLNSFLALARPQEPALAAVDLQALFGELAPLVEPEARQQGAEVLWRPTALTVAADSDLLRRALLNLVLNALRAVDRGGEVVVETQRHDWTVSLSVRDNGCGIAQEDVARVTEPYFSRFEDGTGLGLSIVDQVARAHGWTLTVSSTVGEGTCVSLAGMAQPETAHD